MKLLCQRVISSPCPLQRGKCKRSNPSSFIGNYVCPPLEGGVLARCVGRGRILLLILFLFSSFCAAQNAVNYNQSNLAKRVTLDLKQHKISNVLQKIGKAGGFYFTYNGALFAQDSVVNINVRNKPVREVLEELFDGKVAYRENDEY